MKKLFSIMAVTVMMFGGSINALAYTDHYVDNDNVPTSDGTNGHYGFEPLMQASSSYRGDHRDSTASTDYYYWLADAYATDNTVEYYVYLNSISFVNPSAEYYVGGDNGNTDRHFLNQNAAPGGWNLVGTVNFNLPEQEPTQLYCEVLGWNYTTTGADGVRFRVY